MDADSYVELACTRMPDGGMFSWDAQANWGCWAPHTNLHGSLTAKHKVSSCESPKYCAYQAKAKVLRLSKRVATVHVLGT